MKFLQVSLEGFETAVIFLPRILLCNGAFFFFAERQDAALSVTKGPAWKNFFALFLGQQEE